MDIGWEQYDLIDNIGMSDTMTENFEEIENMSSLILILTCISGVFIICLVFLFWLKGRVHEIGIFLSIGRTKTSIIAQMLLEGVLVGCVAFLLATAVSPMVSKGVVGYLVEYQVQLQAEEKQLDSGMEVISLLENEPSEIKEITVEIDEYVIFLSGTSVLGVIMLAITLSCISIMVQKPRESLSKMS